MTDAKAKQILRSASVTFSRYCRSGIVGDLCRCWRCRGDDGPSEDERPAERDAQLVDRAKHWTIQT